MENQRKYHKTLAAKMGDKPRVLLEMKKSENIEGALVSLNPETGEILAYAGGYEFAVNSQNDHAEQIVRQPGSSFKPLVYAAALENRDITASTVFVDEKTVFSGGYSPNNYSGKFEGAMTAREALRQSVNVIAVKVLEKTGYDRVFEIIRNSLALENGEMKKRFGRTLSFALGTYEVSPMENAVLHSVIANGGNFIRPYGIRHVKDYNGNIVWNDEEAVLEETAEMRKKMGKIIDPVACAIVISILKDPPYGIVGKKLKTLVAAKTGTSTNHNDAWVVGYSRDMVTAIWIGNREGAISLGNGRGGSAVAVPVLSSYLSEIFRRGLPGEFILHDEGASRETICRDSGEVAGKNGECPHVVADQLYYAGTEPGKLCHLHVKLEGEPKPEGGSKVSTLGYFPRSNTY